MFAPYTSTKQTLSLKQCCFIFPFLLLVIFIAVALLSSSFSKRLLYFDNISTALEGIKAETFLEMVSWENPYYTNELPEGYERISFSKMAFHTVTKIDFKDERSLLGNELPGFSVFDTKILVAGEGTNYTNVPIESPPPPDSVLSEDSGDKNSSTDKGNKTPSQNEASNAQVFLYNTHSWESYLPLLGKTGAKDANLASTQDQSKNVHLVDQFIISALANSGVQAIEDKDKVTDYTTAYQTSRAFIKSAIASKYNYKLFLDIHRDSSRKENTTTTINGKSYARISIVVGAANPQAQKNSDLANKLHHLLDAKYPGLSKGVFKKSRSEGNGVYNQDLSPHALLIEVGGVDNTKEELQRTAEALADIISEYVKQAGKV
ncbi:stage II sporulation protein P [Pullulanibacillus pueri]|uniref:Stage II sporulation protein P n=1 Tax=Pullulanibacillus pueri TaxID=1437324 RepID=A0A8J2ZUM2_9BACL|nr:stage II sporulation protein P [Pullulanibacillus pueri]MBM7681182.1 stage II sporulation protein P [Pullulanibacillus pueri]GGH77369.1 stage II sporulation protein P [Pullulanibacillus pueri]